MALCTQQHLKRRAFLLILVSAGFFGGGAPAYAQTMGSSPSFSFSENRVLQEPDAPPTEKADRPEPGSDTVPEELFRVRDPFTDVADLGDGRMRYRLYEKPRRLVDTPTGKAVSKNQSPRFREASPFQSLDNGNSGYQFSIPTQGKEPIVVTGLPYERSSGSKFPMRSVQGLGTKASESASVTEYKDAYPGIDVVFEDAGESRFKKIIFTQKPADISVSDTLTFWEEMRLPEGVTAYTDTGRELKTGRHTLLREGLVFELPGEEILSVTAPLVYDASDRDSAREDLSWVVDVDQAARTVRVGIQISAEYLLAPGRAYPVTIDPMYYPCKGSKSDTSCITSLYLRYLTDREATTQELFLGYYNAPDGPASRVPVMRFESIRSLIPSNAIINSAYLRMTFDRTGSGTYSGNVSVVARKITQSWTASGITYSTIRSSLVTQGSSVTLSTGTGRNTVYSWNLTTLVNDWHKGYTANNGVLVEPTPSWTSGATPSWPNRLFIFASSRDASGRSPYLEVDTTIPQPDLTFDSSQTSVDTTTVLPGGGMNVSVRVKNSGNAAAPGTSKVYYYFNPTSEGRTYSSSAKIGETPVAALGVGATEDERFGYVVPSGTAPGTYYLYFKVDGGDAVSESNEINNQWNWIITVSSKPNLTKGSDSMNDTSVRPGQSLSGFVSVKNNSSSATTIGSKVYYYFNRASDGRTYSASAKVTETSFGALSAGSSSSANFSYTVPLGTVPGQYLFYYKIDAPGYVDESDESEFDNVYEWTVTIESADQLEPNDTYSQASDLGSTNSYTNSNLILAAGDSDWFRFTYNGSVYFFAVTGYSGATGAYELQFTRSGSVVRIETADSGGGTVDTYLTLYDTDHASILNEDDDGGDSAFSRIDHDVAPIIHDIDVLGVQFADTATYYRDGATVGISVQLANTGTVQETVGYAMSVIDQTSGNEFPLAGLSPSPVIPAGSQQTVVLYGTVPLDSRMSTSFRQFSVRARAMISDDPDGYDAAESSNRAYFYRYTYADASANEDGDAYSDVVEKVAGTNISGVDVRGVYDPGVRGYTLTSADAKSGVHAADPVNLRTGGFEFTQEDLAIPGRGVPIRWSRTYNSRLAEREGRLGYGWNPSYQIFAYKNQSGAPNVQVYHGGALVSLFETADNGQTYTAPKGSADTLRSDIVNGSPALMYTMQDGVKYVFSKQVTPELYLLEKIEDTNGNASTLSYVDNRGIPMLARVTDASGRSVRLSYGADALWDTVVEITDELGAGAPRTIRYTYDAARNLAETRETRSFDGQNEDIVRQFVYDANHRMTSYTDPRGTILTTAYDGEGRVTAQFEHNPRVDAPGEKRMIYAIAYEGPHPSAEGSTHCTALTTYRAPGDAVQTRLCFDADEMKIYEEDGLGNAMRFAYNGDGMLVAKTNPLGNTVRAEYDGARRKVKEILPDTAFHTETAYEYENAFNRLTRTQTNVSRIEAPETPIETLTTEFSIDPFTGNVLAATDPRGNVETYQYDSRGNRIGTIDKNGAATAYEYDANRNYPVRVSQTVHDAEGAARTETTTFAYDGYGRVTARTTPRGNVYTYRYDTRGNLREETDPLGNTTRYSYDAEDHRVETVDALSRTTSFTYDTDIPASLIRVDEKGSGLPESGWRSVARTHDAVGTLVSETDPNGGVETYSYDAAGRMIGKTDRAGIATSYRYNSAGERVAEETADGRKAEYEYDTRGNLIVARRFVHADAFVQKRFEYDGLDRLVKEIDENGGETAFAYDAGGNRTTVRDASGAETQFFYDAAGQRIGTRSPRAVADPSLRNSSGHSVSRAYDEAGRIAREAYADNTVSLFFYDSDGNPTRTVDRMNADGTNAVHENTVSYDALGRKVSVTNFVGNTESMSYDAVGNLLSATDRMRRTTTFAYDDFNRLIRETDALGFATSYAYDKNSNRVRVTDREGRETSFVYDALNRVTESVDALGRVERVAYTPDGNIASATDALGRATTFTYDLHGRRATETNPAGTVTAYAYDSRGNRIAESIDNTATSFTYDAVNRVASVTHPGGGTDTLEYDADGNITAKTDATGQKTSYAYDALNREVSKTLPDGRVVQRSYDNWGNVASLAEASGSSAFVYDVENRPILETRTIADLPGREFTITRAYEADGALLAIIDAAGRSVSYARDGRGALDRVKYLGQDIVNYAYSPEGSVTETVFRNGIVGSYGYDAARRAVDVRFSKGAETLWRQSYAYDAADNRVSLGDNGRTVTYGYDALDQLTRVSYDGAPEMAFAYDARGNRRSMSMGADTVTYAYAPQSNQIASYTLNSAYEVQVAHDANGNIAEERESRLGTRFRTIAYSWDADHRLLGVQALSAGRPEYLGSLPATSMTFSYDDFGNRVSKKTANDATYYLNDGLAVLSEINGQTGAIKTMVYGHGLVAEIDEFGSLQYAHQDVLGSTVMLSDVSGNIVAEYEYDPFGSLASHSGAAESRYLYTGQEYDPETDLYYYNARYYHPTIGRFVSRDVLLGSDGDSLSRNRYAYVKNNPFKYTDPSGNIFETIWDIGNVLYDAGELVYGLGKTVYGVGKGFATDDWSTAKSGLETTGWAAGGILVDGVATIIPFVPAGATKAVRYADNAVDAASTLKKTKKKLEGVYEFTDTSGKKYVGQSGDIDKRIQQHVKNGKLDPSEVKNVKTKEVLGGKTNREIAEQKRIDELGGIKPGGPLSNVRNPIGPNRQHLLKNIQGSDSYGFVIMPFSSIEGIQGTASAELLGIGGEFTSINGPSLDNK